MYGATPLLVATQYGHDRVVEMLLERADVNVNLPDEEGSTPLHEAANIGNTKVLGLLLEKEGVRVNQGGNSIELCSCDFVLQFILTLLEIFQLKDKKY